jgi:hypothetical protein
LVNAFNGAELHSHRVLTHAADTVDVDVRAERKHERVEVDAFIAYGQRAAGLVDVCDLADAQFNAGAAYERGQAVIADVLPCDALMQPYALDEAFGGADERDVCVGRYASRKAQRAADAGVTAAGNDDAVFGHVCLLVWQTSEPFRL